MGGAELSVARQKSDPQTSDFKLAHLQIYSDALGKLAAIEAAIRPAPEVVAQSNGFKAYDILPPEVIKFAENTSERDKYAVLSHLADFNIVLSPLQFAKYAGLKVSAAYPSALKNMFNHMSMSQNSKLAMLAECVKYGHARKYSLPPHFSLYKPANFYTKEGEHDRICAGVLYLPAHTKTASVPLTSDYKAAIEYCLYKTAVMLRLRNDIHYVTACIQNL
jgi:hypothetical protein